MSWDASLYDAKHGFVSAHGAAVVEWLAPQPGERIVDLGCGTGHLAAQITAAGAHVIGLDSSAEMVAQAREAYPRLDFRVADARDFTLEAPVDAVFSNAVLHWVRPPEAAVACIAAALRTGGRMVVEFGGHGNVAQIVDALKAFTPGTSPWYYPSIAEYATILAQHGLEVRQAVLFDRPTRLEDGPAGLRNWLAMFAGSFLQPLDAPAREQAMRAIEDRVRPALWRDDAWFADYRRLRVIAVKSPA